MQLAQQSCALETPSELSTTGVSRQVASSPTFLRSRLTLIKVIVEENEGSSRS